MTQINYQKLASAEGVLDTLGRRQFPVDLFLKQASESGIPAWMGAADDVAYYIYVANNAPGVIKQAQELVYGGQKLASSRADAARWALDSLPSAGSLRGVGDAAQEVDLAFQRGMSHPGKFISVDDSFASEFRPGLPDVGLGGNAPASLPRGVYKQQPNLPSTERDAATRARIMANRDSGMAPIGQGSRDARAAQEAIAQLPAGAADAYIPPAPGGNRAGGNIDRFRAGFDRGRSPFAANVPLSGIDTDDIGRAGQFGAAIGRHPGYAGAAALTGTAALGAGGYGAYQGLKEDPWYQPALDVLG
jgi:hypothetical protein